jgi:hypothetical protein
MEISDLTKYRAIGKRGHPSPENREWVEHEKETKGRRRREEQHMETAREKQHGESFKSMMIEDKMGFEKLLTQD